MTRHEIMQDNADRDVDFYIYPSSVKQAFGPYSELHIPKEIEKPSKLSYLVGGIVLTYIVAQLLYWSFV